MEPPHQEKLRKPTPLFVHVDTRSYERGARSLEAPAFGRGAFALEKGGRPYQQDSAGMMRFDGDKYTKMILLVADGLAGKKHGEEASNETIINFYNQIREGHGWKEALEDSHKSLRARNDPPATTLVGLEIEGNEAEFFWSGDSLGMVIRGEKIIFITKPHSAVQFYEDAGDPENCPESDRCRIVHALGLERWGYSSRKLELQLGDKVLCVSDGVSDPLGVRSVPEDISRLPLQTDKEFFRILQSAETPLQKVKKIIALTGADIGDNKTALLWEFSPVAHS